MVLLYNFACNVHDVFARSTNQNICSCCTFQQLQLHVIPVIDHSTNPGYIRILHQILKVFISIHINKQLYSSGDIHHYLLYLNLSQDFPCTIAQKVMLSLLDVLQANTLINIITQYTYILKTVIHLIFLKVQKDATSLGDNQAQMYIATFNLLALFI